MCVRRSLFVFSLIDVFGPSEHFVDFLICEFLQNLFDDWVKGGTFRVPSSSPIFLFISWFPFVLV